MRLRLLCAPLLCAALLFGSAGCTAQTAQPTPSPTVSPWADVPAAVVEYALDHIEKTADAYGKWEEGFTFTETELTGLTLAASYDMLPDASVEVYELGYRLKPENPDKVILAGGMALDEEGWLLQTGSPGDPCLVVKNAGGTYTLLGETWTGELSLDGGWEGRLGSLLVGWGTEQGEDAMLEAGRLALCRSWLGRANEIMAPFLGAAPTEGEPYTDENGVVWLRLAGYEKYKDQRMDDQLLGNMHTVFAKELADGFFTRYIYRPDSILLEREGGLYVRQDAAQVLEWDYTADLSTITLDRDYTSADRLEFTAQGTGHGGTLIWRFSMLRINGTWQVCRYYSLAAENWAVPAEFAILAEGTWFGLGSGAAPAALGEPTHVENSEYNKYSEGGCWRTEYYDGAAATRYDDGTDEINGLVTLEITRAGLFTWRGIEVGSSRDAVSASYPEAVNNEYSDSGVPSLFYEAFPHGPGFYMEFFFDQNETLQSITIKNEFD